jgi:rare lipoprotein A
MRVPIRRVRLSIPSRCGKAASAALLLALAAGCSHRQQTAYTPPPPPIQPTGPPAAAPAPQPAYRPERRSSVVNADQQYVQSHAPIYSETGMASWYGPPYNNRAGANGRIYDENDISAANRTLPMGSLIRVTYLRTGESAVMRITDRGPFVAGRILDLSEGAAKAIGLYRAGVGEVRIDVYSAPEPLDSGGRWCVQVGAFSRRKAAVRLEERLQREYRTANVIEFQGPTGYWVRIRPYEGNRTEAVAIVHRLHPAEGEAWLVRLD